MKVQKTRLIQERDPVNMAIKFSEAMSELKDNKPTFDKIDEQTILIRYTEEENETPTATVIKLKAVDNTPRCKDCPFFNSKDGTRRAEHIKWGVCSRYLNSAVSGEKQICKIMKHDDRKDARVKRNEKKKKKSVAI